MSKTIKIIIFMILSSVPFSAISQELSEPIDEDIIEEYSLGYSKWNKRNLTFYVNNSSCHLTAQQRIDAIIAAFNIWSEYTNFTFTQVSSPSIADISISWEEREHHTCAEDESFTYGDRGHTIPYHQAGTTITSRMIIHFNEETNWVISNNPSINNQEVDLIHCALHEIGHALGLGESSVSQAIMEQGNRSGRELKPDDLQGIWTLYGCPFTIDGPYLICNTGDYRMTLPNNLSTSYTTSGAIVNAGSIGSNGVTVSKVYDGRGQLSANILFDNSTYVWSVKKYIGVGTPPLGASIQFSTANGVTGCWASNLANNTFTVENDSSWAYNRIEAKLYKMDNNFNPSQLVWSWSDISTTNARIDGRTAGWYLFMIRGVKDCGNSDWLEQEVEMVDFSMLNFLLDYDAASETLTLTLVEPDSQGTLSAITASSQSISRGTYEVEIWNAQNPIAAKRYKSDLTTSQFSLAGLPSGIYIVRVVKGEKSCSRKFVKR